jgi:hypothetical protein
VSAFEFKPSDWYWIVAASTTEVWSSARAIAVPVADTAYQDWIAGGHFPTPIASQAELEDVLRQHYPPGSLNSYNASERYNKLNNGVVINGTPFASDAVTRSSLNTAYIYSQGNQGATFSWKLPDGSFITLNKQQIAQLQAAVSDFGQKCYTCEDANSTAIDGGTITTLAQIDAAFNAVSNEYSNAMDAFEVRKRRPR